MQSKANWQVKAVECGLVGDNEGVLFRRHVSGCPVATYGRVTQLPQLCPEPRLIKEFDKSKILRIIAKMSL